MQEEPKWIPLSEIEFNDSITYLRFDTDHIHDAQLIICYKESSIISTADFDSTNFRDECGYYISENDIAAWMLLSKPKNK